MSASASDSLDRHARIERGGRVLEHHLHEPPPLRASRLDPIVRTVERDRPVGQLARPTIALATSTCRSPTRRRARRHRRRRCRGRRRRRRDRAPSGSYRTETSRSRARSRCTAVVGRPSTLFAGMPAGRAPSRSRAARARVGPRGTIVGVGQRERTRTPDRLAGVGRATRGSTPGLSRSTLHVGNRGDQRPRVRVRGAPRRRSRFGLLDDPPGVHHDDRCTARRPRRCRGRSAGPRPLSRLTCRAGRDLRLHRDVERGRRLVGDVQLGLAHQPHRDPARRSCRPTARGGRRAPLGAAMRPGEAFGGALVASRAHRRGPRTPRRAASDPHAGFSAVPGFWKTIGSEVPSSRRRSPAAARGRRGRRTRSRRRSPRRARSEWAIASAVTVLPVPTRRRCRRARPVEPSA